MGNGEWGMGRQGDKGTRRQGEMPNAQCPMPNAQLPITHYPLPISN
ncbi:histidine kinase [Tolypothrix sp. VBCCA 56010]